MRNGCLWNYTFEVSTDMDRTIIDPIGYICHITVQIAYIEEHLNKRQYFFERGIHMFIII